MLILLLLFTFIANVHSWAFVSTHSNVVPTLTTDVTLRCFNDDVSQKSSLNLVNRIRILKFDNSTGEWRTFVMKGFSTILNSTEPGDTGFSASGNIDKPKESFLSVTWPVALSDTVGSYKCEVLAFDDQDRTKTFSDMTVEITAYSASVNDLLDIVISMRKHASWEDESVDELQDLAKVTGNNRDSVESLKKVQENIKKELDALEMKHDAEDTSLTNKFLGFRQNVFGGLNKAIEKKVEDNYFELRNWPSGPAAIPAPEGGCPQTPSDTWLQGYINVSVTYGISARLSSQYNHLAKPVVKSNYLSLGFCKKDSTSRINWPKGSYCVYVGTNADCPKYFTSTSITMTISTPRYQSRSISAFVADNPHYTSSRTHFITYYCCRNDGEADKPILLPTTWSFYLYRYKGKCQSVRNANVTSEWIEMSTNAYTTFQYSNSNVHPDGSSRHGRVELCFYQEQSNN